MHEFPLSLVLKGRYITSSLFICNNEFSISFCVSKLCVGIAFKGAQGLLFLPLFSTVTPGIAQGTLNGAGNPTGLDCMQGEDLPHVIAPGFLFFLFIDNSRVWSQLLSMQGMCQPPPFSSLCPHCCLLTRRSSSKKLTGNVIHLWQAQSSDKRR